MSIEFPERYPVPGSPRIKNEDGSNKECSECANCIQKDYGYSNYTVEGTYIHCYLGLHPEDGFDHFYGEDVRNRFAETCEKYCQGGPLLKIDVESENVDNFSPAERIVYEKWEGR